MNKKINIEDNFYGKYSFTHDFGYSVNEEILSIKELLNKYGFSSDDKNILMTMEFIRDISIIIEDKYKEDVEEYDRWRRKQKIIGGEIPVPIKLAKRIWETIVSTGKTLKDIVMGKDEDEKMIEKLLEKFEEENSSLIIEIKKTYKIKKTD